MTKLQYNKKQWTVSISPEHIKRMGWKKRQELYIGKSPDTDFLYIEEMDKKTKKTNKKG